MSLDPKLLTLLVCPLCKGPLSAHHGPAPASGHPMLDALVCRADHLAFPVIDGIPHMLESDALALDEQGEPIPAAG
ncbi:Trm112 family protein [Amphibiibacter pelophylacis]|uniref:Trm112 family protein n=1 Tax=Amphibiibacter pelophylacis TaxID=1799477 RepID=A0ACC6P0C8_9BURK